MKLKLDLDAQTAERLAAASVAARRPISWQAEVLLRKALGLPCRCGPDCADREMVGVKRQEVGSC